MDEENKDLQETASQTPEQEPEQAPASDAAQAAPEAGDEEAALAEAGGDETDDEEQDHFEKLFSVPFTINEEELYHFQLVMAGQQIEKNKKRSRIMSIVEIVLGVIYLGGLLSGSMPGGIFHYVLSLVLLGLGVYGLLYYKYFFEKAMRKSVTKQHKRIAYFNTEIRLDVYPNKCVECFNDKETTNYWHSIGGVIDCADAYYIQLNAKHCLLVPKRCAGDELEPFLRKMCEDFEKSWTSC